MKPLAIFDSVKVEYGEPIALLVVAAAAISMSTRPKAKDFTAKGRYGERVRKKVRRHLWEDSKEDVDLVLKIVDAWNEFDSRRALEGMGGCTRATLREIVERKERVERKDT